jgi:predicted transglutaminase-like cysteine proteinase
MAVQVFCPATAAMGEVLAIEVGDCEDEAFWTAFRRRLRERGLSGVQLVISDAQAVGQGGRADIP